MPPSKTGRNLFAVIFCLLLLWTASNLYRKHLRGLPSQLIQAVERNDFAAVKSLLERGVDVNAKNEFRQTPLNSAVNNRNPRMVNLLLEHGASPNDGSLATAASMGNKALVETLLAHGADPRVASQSIPIRGTDAPERYTAFYDAIGGGHIDIMRLLMAHGADVNAVDRYGYTPLMAAAEMNRAEAAIFLLDAGAKLEARTSAPLFPNYTALLLASRAGAADVVEALIARKANLQAADVNGFTPLLVAAEYRYYLPVVKALLAAGVGTEARVRSGVYTGYTPLLLAACFGHTDIVKTLIAHKANVNVRGRDGSTALRLAQRNSYREIVALLKQAGAQE